MTDGNSDAMYNRAEVQSINDSVFHDNRRVRYSSLG